MPTASIRHCRRAYHRWLHLHWLEAMLILAILSLLVQVFSPRIIDWWQMPSPGNVGIDYLEDDFYLKNQNAVLARGYLGYLPTNYAQKQKDNAWPLIIALHGAGERGNDPNILTNWGNLIVSSHPSDPPAVVLMPQCRKQRSWQTEDVKAFVAYACDKYRIDRQRIYLVGFSMGAHGTWATAAAYPDTFAAIVPIAGGGSVENAKTLAPIPIWAFHGERDKTVPAKQSKNMVNAIRQAGGNPKLTLFAKAGHGIPRRAYRTPGLWEWLFQQNLTNRPVLQRQMDSQVDTDSQVDAKAKN